MRKIISFIFLLFFTLVAFAQQPSRDSGGRDLPAQVDSLQKPPIIAYKIISIKGDTTFVDTTLSIQKDYKFNYLRKDNFELLQFANVGQTYNSLALDFRDENLIPQLGARARHFNFMEAGDINYYEVPTPLTELFFKTVPEQGQTLDAFFTINTSPRLNFSLAYKGLRSLGKYQNSLTSTGNFRTTLSYNTLNNRYRVKTHFVSQDLLNRENGGLDPIALEQYINKEEEFEDRSLLEVQFEDAENILYGKRFYLDQEFSLLPGTRNNISIFHVLDFSDKKYIFRQTNPFEDFGESLRNSNLNDEVKLRHINNRAGVAFSNSTLGRLAGKVGHSYYNYGYNSVIFFVNEAVANRLKGNNYSAGADYSNSFGPLKVYGDAMVNVAGDFTGHYLTGGITYTLNANNLLNVEINSNERAPNFNFLLYQSDYLNYNWQNDFSNQGTRVLNATLVSPRLVNIEAGITNITNYKYFGSDESGGVKPFQYDDALNYIKIKAQREFHYGRFSLDNTVMYQKVAEGNSVFNVPELVTRNTLYYRDHWFKRALYLQTGLTLKYFTSYNMNAYDPVLAEFYVQNDAEFGNYPVVDFFFNGKIRQTRIYFKLEHLNSLIAGNNNFVAPGYPHRDFIVRFGLVWNFFL